MPECFLAGINGSRFRYRAMMYSVGDDRLYSEFPGRIMLCRMTCHLLCLLVNSIRSCTMHDALD